MKKTILIIPIVVIFVVILISLFGSNMLSKLLTTKPQSGSISPDILYLTQPVYNFSGTIEKIEDNILVVGRDPSQFSPAPGVFNPANQTKFSQQPLPPK